jgi:hypothetical protein
LKEPRQADKMPVSKKQAQNPTQTEYGFRKKMDPSGIPRNTKQVFEKEK